MVQEKFDLEKLNQSKNKKIWFNKNEKDFYISFIEYLTSLSELSASTEFNILNGSFVKHLNEKEIEINNIYFNYFNYEYTKIIKCFKKVNFVNCYFNVNQIELESNVFFNKCYFNNDDEKINIFVSNYVKSNSSEDVLFNRSIFKNKIQLNKLSEYIDEKFITVINVNLFTNCELNGLLAKNIRFKSNFFINKVTLLDEKLYSKLEGEYSLINCIFEKEFKIKDSNSIKEINFRETIFQDKCKIVECEIENTIFKQTKFLKLTGFDNTKFEKIDFRNARFFSLVRFNKTRFLQSVNFDYTYFNDYSIFTNANFFNKLNLEKTFFKYPGNFLNIKNKENEKYKIDVENRETARIIKDSFEQQNNIIEANRFYALEMKEREKELKWSDNFFDKLVFKFHELSSNHSQNWLLPIFWIVFFGLICSFFEPMNNYTFTEYDYIYKELFIAISISCITYITLFSFINFKLYYLYLIAFPLILMVYINYTSDIYFNIFSNILNPFSIMTKGEDLTFGILVFKIIITYLIYQLIISIRQNTRRK